MWFSNLSQYDPVIMFSFGVIGVSIPLLIIDSSLTYNKGIIIHCLGMAGTASHLFLHKLKNTARVNSLIAIFSTAYVMSTDWSTGGTTGCWSSLFILWTTQQNQLKYTKETTCFMYLLFTALKCADSIADINIFPEGVSSKPARAIKAFLIQLCCLIGGYISSTEQKSRSPSSPLRISEISTVDLAMRVAEAMVKFDLDEAEKLLHENPAGGTDDLELEAALKSLLLNLRQFRPYLPEALFVDTIMSPRAQHLLTVRRDPPGIDENEQPTPVAIVFTDIENSAFLWQRCHVGMKRALKTHNTIMREAIVVNNGYEVKTIGDSFMVAFDSVLEAGSFCLLVQTRMVSTAWSPELTMLNEKIKIRIGLHFGHVEVEENPITNRYDYFGPTVNKASRCEQQSVGGTIAITVEALSFLPNHMLLELGDPCSYPLGNIDLKGIGPTAITLLYPRILESMHVTKQHIQHRTTLNVQRDISQIKRTSASILFNDESVIRMPFLQGKLKPSGDVSIAQTRIEFSYLTCCYDPLTAVNDVLNLLVDCTERCEGSIVSVCSNSVVSSWNTARKCQYHLQNGIRFCRKLHDSVSETLWNNRVHVGVATGSALYGNVGSLDQRFVIIVGACVEMAGKLVKCAKEFGTYCLHSSLPGHLDASADPCLRSVVRPVDKWQISEGAGGRILIIHEVNVSLVSDNLNLRQDNDVGWGWTDDYRRAFEDEDHNRILACGDPVLNKVADLMNTNTHLRTLTPGYTVHGSGSRSTSRSCTDSEAP